MKVIAWRVWTKEISSTGEELVANLTGCIWVTYIFLDVGVTSNYTNILLLMVIEQIYEAEVKKGFIVDYVVGSDVVRRETLLCLNSVCNGVGDR